MNPSIRVANKMNIDDLSDDNALLQQARMLANFIDSKAGGYPLINGIPDAVGRGVLWQYGDYDFLVYYGGSQRKFPTQSQLKKSSPGNLYFLNLEEALEFIRITEAIRQKTIYPYIQLGRMPRTTFMQAL
jgi:hypothetical protein